MMRDFLAYAEFEGFWERFRPETPFGREEKEKLSILSDPRELSAIWDGTDALLAFLEELERDEVRLNRITHHLKRIPRFPEEAHPVYDEVEIFQFKKFLHNYKSLRELLSPAVRAAFGFPFASEAFGERLDVGRQSAESFYVSDDYAAELGRVRREIRELDDAIRQARDAQAAEILARWDLEFGSREFLVVRRALLGDIAAASQWLLVEPYDDSNHLVRLRRNAEELALSDQRAHLLAQERSCEEAVLESLSEAARQELPRLLEYRDVVRDFDLALARARLAREHGLVRPVLGTGPVRIQQGRFLPCEEACQAMGTPYTPLEVDFDPGVTVVFGSNMGGKTVVLKTVAFLQLCAQTGLFVPAAAFETRIFRGFHYLGEGCAKDGAQGLSGFGFEIRQLTRSLERPQGASLLLFDEFARTTNSHEAEAIISAVIEFLAEDQGVTALFSTHFRGIRRLEQVRHLTMKGLDHGALDLGATSEASLDDRIRFINRHMDHRLVPDDGSRSISDAIAVAALLGLAPAIAERADHFFRTSVQE